MKTRPRIRDRESVEDARKLIHAGANVELVLLFFRDRGFDLADCIYALQELFDKPFAEAKELVSHSQTWSHQYQSSRELREAAREALRQLASSQSVDLPHIEFDDDGE